MDTIAKIQINKDLPLRSRRLNRDELRSVFGMAGALKEGERCELANCESECEPGLKCVRVAGSPTLDTAVTAVYFIVPTGLEQIGHAVGFGSTCESFDGRR